MLEAIKDFLWGYIFIPLFLVAGAVCFFVNLCRKKTEKDETANEGEVSAVSTLFVALASSIGTGNIVGVSLAITIGGAGAVFWMWVAALMGMCVSYRENVMGVDYRDKEKPIGYMPDNILKIFSFFCVLSTFGMGNLTQSNSAANALYTGFGVKRWMTGILLAVLTYLIIRGGLLRIAKFTDRFVPLAGAVYMIFAVFIIWLNRSAFLKTMEDILREAFSAKAITGGAVYTGMGRGILSGEAGLGSTVILSSKSNVKNAHTQGIVGMTAIFIDTVVICSLTAFAVLTSSAQSASAAFYKSLGDIGGNVLNISMMLFAFSTIIGWSYFGLTAINYLTNEKWGEGYKKAFAFAVFLGAVMKLEVVWNIGDIASALMAVPNLLCVIFYTVKSLAIKKNFNASTPAASQNTDFEYYYP